ncbi:BON domain-containing protein [Glaciibacter superstes]|uniref:BON domain-containing protein n=1 Tax=Glaciibacter superstes TaxID=501023 RepID=UPI0003B7B611|nr:BON domain-containing protein [Glaciibacter superstes]
MTDSVPESSPDRHTRAAVLVALAWDEAVDATGIRVRADRGVVTLTGMISGLAERVAASMAAMRVAGVDAVVDELTDRA